MIPSLQALRSHGLISALDEHFARTMGRLARDDRPEVLLIAALVSHAAMDGHVCLDLTRMGTGPVLDSEGLPVADLQWPELEGWLSALRSSPMLGEGQATTPLVFDGRARVHLRRYWEHEKGVAELLLSRASQWNTGLDEDLLRDGLKRLFGDVRSSEEPDWQRVAAAVALQRPLLVVSGGPGTGKTTMVVKIVTLLLEQAQRAGKEGLHATLLAPTGKAAARLSDSIRRAKAEIDCALWVKDRIPDHASTIHRCLKPIGESTTRFRHGLANPLLTDVIVVDEASMVDVGLMRRLLEAAPPAAKIILLGDKDQLASVEAGAILGDICNRDRFPGMSVQAANRLRELTGEPVPIGQHAPAAHGIGDCLVRLVRGYRAKGEGIEELATAIRTGDTNAVVEILGSSRYPGVVLKPMSGPGELVERLPEDAVAGYGPYLEAESPAHKAKAFDRFRVLCAHRRGAFGCERVNALVEESLAEAWGLNPQGTWYEGRPVLIVENDYRLGLFNGDIGLVLRDRQGTGLRAVFSSAEGEERELAPSRIGAHETAFAMTVHKSQGSEFDEVVVVLPDYISPVLTRELLYTAVTRARWKVTLYGRSDVIAGAVARRLDRASGLREMLWGIDGPEPEGAPARPRDPGRSALRG